MNFIPQPRYRKGRRRRGLTTAVFFCASCLSLLVLAVATLFIGLRLDVVLTDEFEDGPENHVSRQERDMEGVDATDDPPHDSSLSPSSQLNCTPPSSENFPPNVMSLDVLRHGGLLINFAAVFYLFGVLAIVCDNYFMPSLESLCSDLKLSEDVAGASFMAIGGSAPELFTSIFGVFIAKGNIGVGTVIGSAVFNILCVIGLCGLLAGQVVYLTKWPLARDSLWYSVSILCLILVILDNQVHWYESLIFLILYIAYLVFLFFDPPIKNRLESCSLCVTNHDGEEEPIVNDSTPIRADSEWNTSSIGTEDKKISSEKPPDGEDQGVEENPLSPFVVPSGCCKRFLWVISFPASIIFYITIPNCSLERWKRWYPVTFVMSLFWIGGVTYVLVWMVIILGYVLSLPDTVMGLTLLAAGSSTPDTILSVIAARNGYGDMAISHSIGSNIFDILLGLGLPWFLHSAAVHHGEPVQTHSDGLTLIVGMLLLTVIITLIIIRLSSFKLNKINGTILIVLYVIFLVPAILLEMNILIKGLVLPDCKRSEI